MNQRIKKKKFKKYRLDYLIWCFNIKTKPTDLFKWKNWTQKQEQQMWERFIISNQSRFIELK